MIVEPDFPDRGGAMFLRGAANDIAGGVNSSGKLSRLMRVHAGAEVNVGPRLPHELRASRFLVITGGEDAKCGRHARRSRARHHRSEIGRELLAGEMTV